MSVARQLGRWLQADPSFWVDDSLIWQFDAAMGIESGLMALEHEAKTDPDVASYIAGLRMTREIRNAASKIFDGTGYTGAEVVVHVRENPKDRCIWLPRWGMQADSEQRETVFAALLSCDEPKQIKRLLRCFQKKGVPRFDRRLLRWIDSSDQELRWAAVRAVAPTKHLELRQMAIRLISDGEIADGIALLVNNFEAGDFAFCARHLKLRDDPDEVHNLVGELLDLCEANPDSDALDCLLYVYEFSPCSICRGRAVKALMDKSTAPDWVQAEAAFDANPEIRTLVGAGVPPQ